MLLSGKVSRRTRLAAFDHVSADVGAVVHAVIIVACLGASITAWSGSPTRTPEYAASFCWAVLLLAALRSVLPSLKRSRAGWEVDGTLSLATVIVDLVDVLIADGASDAVRLYTAPLDSQPAEHVGTYHTEPGASPSAVVLHRCRAPTK